MRRTTVLIVCAIGITVPAYPACTPNTSKAKPYVCIDRSTGKPDRDPVYAYGKAKVRFKFSDGKGKLHIRFLDGGFHDYYHSGSYASAKADDVKANETHHYEISDGDKKLDPEVIIEPAPPPPPFGHKGH